MAETFHILVINQMLTGGTTYTSPELYEILGDADSLAISVSLEAITAVHQFVLQVEHSADARNWHNRNATPEIDTAPPGPVLRSVVYDVGSTPSLGLVRFRLKIHNVFDPAAGSAFAVIYATGRGL